MIISTQISTNKTQTLVLSNQTLIDQIDYAVFFYRPYFRYALQCRFFTLALYEVIQRQLFHPSKKMILNSCQPKKSHHGQVS